MEKYVTNFLLALLHSGTNTHLMHWATDSYAQHVALGTYYDSIIDLVDAYAEAYMGKYGQLKKFPSEYHQHDDPVRYLVSVNKFVGDVRGKLPQDPELNQLVDNIQELLDTTIYKLKYLK